MVCTGTWPSVWKSLFAIGQKSFIQYSGHTFRRENGKKDGFCNLDPKVTFTYKSQRAAKRAWCFHSGIMMLCSRCEVVSELLWWLVTFLFLYVFWFSETNQVSVDSSSERVRGIWTFYFMSQWEQLCLFKTVTVMLGWTTELASSLMRSHPHWTQRVTWSSRRRECPCCNKSCTLHEPSNVQCAQLGPGSLVLRRGCMLFPVWMRPDPGFLMLVPPKRPPLFGLPCHRNIDKGPC